MNNGNNKYVIVEFKDGLQIIPITWLTTDLKRAKWPNSYITNKRYDKAVRYMEEPKSTWEEHPVIKIYATCAEYTVARRKLKLAEQLSDINTCSEKEDYFKKSRKIRAARTYSSSDYDSEQSDDEIISSLPNPPSKQSDNEGTSKKKDVLQPHTQLKNNKSTLYTKTSRDDITPSSSFHTETVEEIDFFLQQTANDDQYEVERQVNKENAVPCCLSSYTSSDINYEQNSQRTTNILQPVTVNTKGQNNGNKVPHILSGHTNSHLNYNQSVQCAVNSDKQLDNKNIPPSQTSTSGIINYEGGSSFERYVVQTFQHLKIKISNIEKRQKQILDKMSYTVQSEEEQKKIDIFQDLPVKNKPDLEAVEVKLADALYKNEMIRQLVRLTAQEVKHSCLCLMKQTVSNEVAILYSWQGAKGKENFSKLNLCQVILKVIRNAHENVKNEQISQTIKVWLAHAKERINRERGKKRKRDEEGDVRNNEPQPQLQLQQPEQGQLLLQQ